MAGTGEASIGRRSAATVAARLAGHARFDLRDFLRAAVALEVERRRLFPWIAVAFGTGILLYFAAEGRPVLWAPLSAALLSVAGAVASRHRPIGRAVLIGSAAAFLGFAACVIRVATVEAPRLERTSIFKLAGFVESVEERPEGARAVILVHSLGDLSPDRRPARVRVSVRKREPALAAGAFVTATARLLPPPEPARPGGYDFGRDAFFRGLGGVGSLVGKVEAGAAPVPRPWGLAVSAGIDEARNVLTRRIAGAIGGQAGAVAAALITGKRGLIDEDTNAALRGAGIYHVVSISGLHMVLAAGAVFWIVRAVLALAPGIALLWPVKKVAAVAAMLGATAYCVFSGMDVAAERSLVMTLVMLGAILADRPALSMRNLALSALIVLAREPEALLGPSFQMSYGAVAALIAASGALGPRILFREERGPLTRAVAWTLAAVIGALATTLVATLATAPFGTFHFQNLNPYGLIGNAVTLPLVSVVIMPAAVVGVIAYPFGLDGPVWWVMGWAVQGMLSLSQWVSGFAHSTVIVPAYGPGALGLLAAGLILLTIPASALRWIGVVPIGIGLAVASATRPSDILIDRDGSGAAVRGASGRLVVVGRAPAFVVEQWLKADGDARNPRDPSVREGARCDRVGCVVDAAGNETVAYVADRRAFEEDCARATIVLTRLTAPPACAARLVIDRAYLAAHGATALRFTGAGPEIASARDPKDARPWVRAPPSDAAQPRARAKGPGPTENEPGEPAAGPADGDADPP